MFNFFTEFLYSSFVVGVGSYRLVNMYEDVRFPFYFFLVWDCCQFLLFVLFFLFLFFFVFPVLWFCCEKEKEIVRRKKNGEGFFWVRNP